MIAVDVQLFGPLRDYFPRSSAGRQTVEVPAGATVDAMLAQLGIDDVVIVAVNESHESDLDAILAPGDRVIVFEATAGG